MEIWSVKHISKLFAEKNLTETKIGSEALKLDDGTVFSGF